MHSLRSLSCRAGGIDVVHRLPALLRQFQDDREGVLREVAWPVLVWDSMPRVPRPLARVEPPTMSGRLPLRAVEPVVFELSPRFPGSGTDVTVGRSPDCDIVLSEPSVSRQHARFRPEPHTSLWSVTDLESHFGTFQDGVLIVPGRPSPLFSMTTLRLGGAEVVFLQASAFEQYARSWALASGARLTRGG
ncbi:FHA domain-containing protein [Myxococcus stipitatus]|uniref:FHA domain-containing protein n=1 Tax=Myxococcus stipitatus TaxID=83455 RepID=UPI001F41E908|nr:FHA domain-containing protein [Myxococcus stipitatus]MCE9670594.1 FHA domain-containing protein [Myxococcus stipitatus]